MPLYAYTARDLDGLPVSGSLTALDERQVREQLRRNNLFITRLEVDAKSATTGGTGAFKKKVKLYDLVVFSRQLSTLVRAGLPLTEAFDALAEQTKNPTLQAALIEIKTDISTGSTLTAAMKRHPKIFSELFIALVEAGELGGLLDTTLDSAAQQLDTEMEIREKVKSAFVYPIAVLITAIGVVCFLLAYVVPIFAKVYKSFHADLPAITNSLVVASEALRGYWWLGLLMIVAAIIAWQRAYTTYRGRRVLDGFKLKIPLFGGLIEKIGLARMSHTLAALTEAGVPLTRALGTAGRTSGNSLIMDALSEVSLKIQQGNDMGTSMAGTGRFPVLMTRMIAAGEHAGNLGEMIEQVAHFFDREVDYGVKRLMTLIEPILTVFMGLIVGFILLALYYPIFNLGNVIK